MSQMLDEVRDVDEGKKLEAEQMLVKKRLGFLPTSIWRITKTKTLNRYVDDEMAKGTYGGWKQGKTGRKYVWNEPKEARLSQFNPVVAERVIKIWSKEGEKILDPFSGRCRALIAQKLNRQYFGYEISPKAHAKMKERLARNTLTPFKFPAQVICGDSAKINTVNEFDMVFSCPPYWDVEDYDKCYVEKTEGQLSSLHEYKDFLKQYGKIIKKCYTALKPGKFCVWVVNDIRRDKRLIPFGSDTINLFEQAGFHFHDIIINELFGLAIMGVRRVLTLNYVPKMHEYILVFKKPEEELR